MTAPDAALRLIAEALVQLANTPATVTHTVTVTETLSTALTWNLARLYDVPDATRLDAADLAAVLGMARGALYKKLRREAIPHRKRRDRTIVFVAADVRRWLENGETVVTPVPDYGPRPRRVR